MCDQSLKSFLFYQEPVTYSQGRVPHATCVNGSEAGMLGKTEHQGLWNKEEALNFTFFQNSFSGNWDLNLRQMQAVELIHSGPLFCSPKSNCMIVSNMEQKEAWILPLPLH